MEFLALVIEPDEELRRLVHEALKEDGWRVVEACAVGEALNIIRRQQNFPLVYCAESLLDGGDCSAVESNIIDTLRDYLGEASFIVMMGAGNGAQDALESIMAGASDFLKWPVNSDDVLKLAHAVRQRLQTACLESSQPALSIHPNVIEADPPELNLVGASEAIVGVFKRIAQSLKYRRSFGNRAKNNVGTKSPSYFITGETGTGKELVAQLIHQRSRYAAGSFIPINCSALPEDLAESELFGYEPGAFTGATKEKKGLWELANGGTLFLDEITEAPRAIWPKLLRVLQERTIKRLGSNRWISVDTQIIAASNRGIREEIQAGRFREDLYHRLSLFQLHLPPLRERHEDIPLLVTHFTRRYADRPVHFSQDALDLLMQYPWPGNVRELENVVRAAVTHVADGMVYAVDLLPRLQVHREATFLCPSCHDGVAPGILGATAPSSPSLDAQVEEFKLKMVKEALRQHRGNVTHAAASLGMTRPTLYKFLKKLEVAN